MKGRRKDGTLNPGGGDGGGTTKGRKKEKRKKGGRKAGKERWKEGGKELHTPSLSAWLHAGAFALACQGREEEGGREGRRSRRRGSDCVYQQPLCGDNSMFRRDEHGRKERKEEKGAQMYELLASL